MQQLATPRLRLIYDYSHLTLQGFGLEPTLAELLPWVAFISLKDARGTAGHHEYLLPGDGNIDYVEYFGALKRLGYRGFVGVEVSSMIHQKPGYDPVATARLCYERLAPAFTKAGLDRPQRQRRTRN
jgi:inosose dehydratase